MTLPSALRDFFRERFGGDVTDSSPVGGGCINETMQVSLEDGSRFFVKQNRITLREMFEKEAKGLGILVDAAGGSGSGDVSDKCGTDDSGPGDTANSGGTVESGTGQSGDIRIPGVVGLTEDNESGLAFLVLDFIEEGRSSGDFDRRFGRALASIHRHTASRYGLDHDNYIGRLPQKNDYRDTWTEFFIDCRLEPQFAMARERGFLGGQGRQSLDRLAKRLPDLLPVEPPSLLHGDLWGGNYLCDSDNRPVLIDPAVYYGHREAELAFTTLFGGFGRNFYTGYEEAWPLHPGFRERCDIYNLYPLLVHVNLFGGMYVSQTEAILGRF
jgi:protein-ribulosamine 3-kinase